MAWIVEVPLPDRRAETGPDVVISGADAYVYALELQALLTHRMFRVRSPNFEVLERLVTTLAAPQPPTHAHSSPNVNT